jgi:hypothetical protein
MPLHDWTDLSGWEVVHHYWLSELGRSVKSQLPAGYRAFPASSPDLKIGTDLGKPDVAVRQWDQSNGKTGGPMVSQRIEPESEEVVTLTLDPDLALLITYHGKLAAAIEIISPGNKDRPARRAFYLGRYFGYLKVQASVLLVDVHPQPYGFSFADALAVELDQHQAPLPCPMAISYEVRGPATSGGAVIGTWRRALTPGQPIPTLPLSLSEDLQIKIDLEGTYSRAAADAYLE